MKRSLMHAMLSLLFALEAFSARAAEPVRVACIGTSITWGAGVAGQLREQFCYPAQMQGLLGTQEYLVSNFGKPGACVLSQADLPYMTTAEYSAARAFAPRWIVIELGTNDSKAHNWQYRDDFTGDLRALLGVFDSLPSVERIWLCTPPPVFASVSGIEATVIHNQIAPLIRQVALADGYPLIDLHDSLAGRSTLFADGVHPNEDGAAEIAFTVGTMLYWYASPANTTNPRMHRIDGRAAMESSVLTICGGRSVVRRDAKPAFSVLGRSMRGWMGAASVALIFEHAR